MTDTDRAYTSICTYCLQAVDIRDSDTMRRTLCWMDVPTPQIGPAALPVLLNEWGHRRCVIDRARERAKQLAELGAPGARRMSSRSGAPAGTFRGPPR